MLVKVSFDCLQTQLTCLFTCTGLTDASIMPLLAHMVDVRHVAGYGSVYSIAQFAISLGFAIGWFL
jgi:MFS transporter, DHA1 family, solute carrier family 18 (vesicular amine transporter), member 1/2